MAKLMSRSFAQKVYELTRQIPRGRVSTYGAIARTLGRPDAARAVGRILSANPQPIVVPCHRVVYSNGKLGGYTGGKGTATKIELLTQEGVPVDHGRVRDFRTLLFAEFR